MITFGGNIKWKTGSCHYFPLHSCSSADGSNFILCQMKLKFKVSECNQKNVGKHALGAYRLQEINANKMQVFTIHHSSWLLSLQWVLQFCLRHRHTSSLAWDLDARRLYPTRSPGRRIPQKRREASNGICWHHRPSNCQLCHNFSPTLDSMRLQGLRRL